MNRAAATLIGTHDFAAFATQEDRQTVRELNALTTRDLDDLGISRSMITRLAHEAAWGSAQ